MARYTNESIIGAALRGETAETSNGNMSTHDRRPFPYVGRLPKVWAEHMRERHTAGHVSQVIYSYNTPIAWLDDEHGWIVPVVTYSATTSTKHQTHLWKLRSDRRVFLPWDATPEDLRRVMDRKMYFGNDGRGNAMRTYPGPNYVEGE